jgi:hypothetical protein
MIPMLSIASLRMMLQSPREKPYELIPRLHETARFLDIAGIVLAKKFNPTKPRVYVLVKAQLNDPLKVGPGFATNLAFCKIPWVKTHLLVDFF